MDLRSLAPALGNQLASEFFFQECITVKKLEFKYAGMKV